LSELLLADGRYDADHISKGEFMNTMTIIGIILIALGVFGLIYGGITYSSSKDIVEVGSMHLQVDQKKQILLSPIAGAAAVAVGVILILIGRRRLSDGNMV
jgi:hypothetical protein